MMTVDDYIPDFGVGDRIVFTESTQWGRIIHLYGIVICRDVGWSAYKHGPPAEGYICTYSTDPKAHIPNVERFIVASVDFVVVAVPHYDKRSGTVLWQPYSVMKSHIQYDRASIRAESEAAREKKYAAEKARILKEAPQAVLYKIVGEIIAKTFALPSYKRMPTEADLAAYIIMMGGHPPVDVAQLADEYAASQLCDFDQRMMDFEPQDF